MSYADKTITCRDCGNGFVFTVGEQEFYAQKGFNNEPTRCPSCRQARKAAGGSGGSRDSYSSGGGGGYNSGGYSSGGGSYSSRDSYGGDSFGGGGGGYSSRGPREMHSATCASCGREAKVPFVPRGDKPVYCSDCFQQQPRRSSSSRW